MEKDYRVGSHLIRMASWAELMFGAIATIYCSWFRYVTQTLTIGSSAWWGYLMAGTIMLGAPTMLCDSVWRVIRRFMAKRAPVYSEIPDLGSLRYERYLQVCERLYDDEDRQMKEALSMYVGGAVTKAMVAMLVIFVVPWTDAKLCSAIIALYIVGAFFVLWVLACTSRDLWHLHTDAKETI